MCKEAQGFSIEKIWKIAIYSRYRGELHRVLIYKRSLNGDVPGEGLGGKHKFSAMPMFITCDWLNLLSGRFKPVY